MKWVERDEIHVPIRGAMWTIQFVGRKDMPRATWGDCNHEKRLIRVRKDLSPLNFTDTLIHEIKHAQQYELDEQFVSETATEMASIIFATNKFDVYPRGKPQKNKKRN